MNEEAARNEEFPQGYLLVQTVDLDAIADNVSVIRKHAGGAEVMAVVKADGYSQGAVAAATAALSGGASELGVATLEEALDLRNGLPQRSDQEVAASEGLAPTSRALVARQVPITCWMWHPDQAVELEAAVVSGITVSVLSRSHLQALLTVNQNTGVTPHVTIKVDSGLGRSGISLDNGDFDHLLPELVQAHKFNQIRIDGLMTHFACADNPDDPSVSDQVELFRQAIAKVEQAGVQPLRNHAANSAAALSRPDVAFDLVRPGLAIYGLEPINGRDHGLRPAMRWEAKVALVKRLRKGQSVSYGKTWTATEDTTIAVIPCGYADGMPRAASGSFEVSINGKRYPQVGRVCMDQFVVDLGADSGVDAGADSGVPVKAGDIAVIVGDPARGEPSADELAEAIGTINYEVLTAPRGRTHRQFVGGTTRDADHQQDKLQFDNWYETEDVPDTHQLGEQFGAILAAGDVVILDGPLGAGKTTFTQGIARGLQVRGRVTSPTFTIARHHRPHPESPTGCALIHVDAYRLFGEEGPDASMSEEQGWQALDALDALDLDTDLSNSVVVAEWGAGLADQLAESYYIVRIERGTTANDETRRIRFEQHRRQQ